MDRGAMRLIVENGHFTGYDLNHKKKVRRTVLTAQAMADKVLGEERPLLFKKNTDVIMMATGS